MMESKKHPLAVIEHGLMKIDLQKQLVTVKDKILHLGKVEIAILASLVKTTGQVVCPESMRKELESHGQFFNKTIQHNIRELKRVLKESAGDTFQIKRITGLGYQLLTR
jgi:DNA-binding response OmpR family regulator